MNLYYVRFYECVIICLDPKEVVATSCAMCEMDWRSWSLDAYVWICNDTPLNRDPWVCLGVKFAELSRNNQSSQAHRYFHFRDAERHGHIPGWIIPRVILILNAIYCFSLSCKIFLVVLALGNSVKNSITLDDETGFVLFVLIFQITANVFVCFTEL